MLWSQLWPITPVCARRCTCCDHTCVCTALYVPWSHLVCTALHVPWLRLLVLGVARAVITLACARRCTCCDHTCERSHCLCTGVARNVITPVCVYGLVRDVITRVCDHTCVCIALYVTWSHPCVHGIACAVKAVADSRLHNFALMSASTPSATVPFSVTMAGYNEASRQTCRALANQLIWKCFIVWHQSIQLLLEVNDFFNVLFCCCLE